jgi:hypothetical protein
MSFHINKYGHHHSFTEEDEDVADPDRQSELRCSQCDFVSAQKRVLSQHEKKEHGNCYILIVDR